MGSTQASRIAGVLFLATLFVVQAAIASSQKSLTWDEPTFLTSGYSYLRTGDFRLNPEAPPGTQMLVAAPLLFLDLQEPDFASADFAAQRQVSFSRDFLRRNQRRLAAITFWGRLPIWILGGLTVWLAASFASRIYGPGSGVMTAFLVSLSPNLLAHGRLATTDLACAVGMLAAVFALYRAVRGARWRDWILLGAATGLALLAKYTSLLLAPIFLVLVLFEWRVRKRRLRDLLPGLGVALLVSYLIVTLAYGAPLDPRPYAQGLGTIYVRATPSYQSYLLGRVSETPFWYHHFVAYLLKAPVPTLSLLAMAAIAHFRGRHKRDGVAYALVPALAVLLVSCFDPMNLGLRRILPALPFLFVFAAQALHPSGRWWRGVVLVLLMWLVAEAALIFPHHLSYFNELAGGPARGPYLLDDSNVDWGQDLPALARWQARHAPGEVLRLHYFGNASPEAYGVRSQPMQDPEVLDPPPGLYAISAHNLVWFRKVGVRLDLDLDWLTRYQPVGRAGWSIYIYQIPAGSQRR